MGKKQRRNPLSLTLAHRWLVVLLVLVFPALCFAQPAYDPGAILLNVRDRLLPELGRLQRYTCVQTITRRYYRPEPHVLTPPCAELIAAHDKRTHELTLLRWDRLRMEVAIADGQNVYSWVGAPRFEEGTLEKLAGSGPLGSGDFGPFLHAILGKAAVSFQEEQTTEDKHFLLYSYQMPLSRSNYRIKGDKGWMPIGYSGTFSLDPAGSDIVTLKIRSDELPGNKAVCQANSEIDYGRVAIHDRAILIPRETRLGIIDPKGTETLSTTEYSNCREYASKSRLFFDAPQDHPATPAAQSSRVAGQIPRGLHFVGRIVTPIDSETAAAGDPVDVVLLKPLRDANRLIAPVGTPLHARLKRVEQWLAGYTQVTLQFETMELNGTAIPVRARADLAPQPQSRGAGSMLVSRDPASLDTTTLTFRGERLHFQQFDWGWTTLPLDPTDDKNF
jgi:hypothetical protein